jgi:hypothetical protein
VREIDTKIAYDLKGHSWYRNTWMAIEIDTKIASDLTCSSAVDGQNIYGWEVAMAWGGEP